MNNKEEIVFMNLVNLLLNPSVDDSCRDDAAMDLSAYDNPKAEEALLKIASDPNENEMVADSCGESIATIWVRNNCFKQLSFTSLSRSAKFAFLNYVKIYKIEWIEKYKLSSP